MSAEIDQVALRDAVFKACNSLDAFESMPYSSIRKETERLLDLKSKALKDRKDEIMDMVLQFRNVHKPQKKKKLAVTADGDIVIKKGKFSVHETDLILSGVRDYVEVHGITLSDVCSEMRAKSDKYNRHFTLWDSISELLPNRTRASIHEHANRKLMADTRIGYFTEDEKTRVLQMVALHGRDWKRIATELGRMTCDIKDLYKVIKSPRKVNGQFSLQETARLVAAMKQITRSPKSMHSYQIPCEKVSWNTIANLLGNERHPLDYLRHWKVVRKHSWLGPDLMAGMVTSAQQRGDDRRVIAYIAAREPEHETELTWSAIDTELKTRKKAMVRWKALCSENLLNYQLDFAGSLQFLMKKLNIAEGGVMLPEDELSVTHGGDYDVTDDEEEEDEGEEEEEEEEELDADGVVVGWPAQVRPTPVTPALTLAAPPAVRTAKETGLSRRTATTAPKVTVAPRRVKESRLEELAATPTAAAATLTGQRRQHTREKLKEIALPAAAIAPAESEEEEKQEDVAMGWPVYSAALAAVLSVATTPAPRKAKARTTGISRTTSTPTAAPMRSLAVPIAPMGAAAAAVPMRVVAPPPPPLLRAAAAPVAPVAAPMRAAAVVIDDDKRGKKRSRSKELAATPTAAATPAEQRRQHTREKREKKKMKKEWEEMSKPAAAAASTVTAEPVDVIVGWPAQVLPTPAFTSALSVATPPVRPREKTRSKTRTPPGTSSTAASTRTPITTTPAPPAPIAPMIAPPAFLMRAAAAPIAPVAAVPMRSVAPPAAAPLRAAAVMVADDKRSGSEEHAATPTAAAATPAELRRQHTREKREKKKEWKEMALRRSRGEI